MTETRPSLLFTCLLLFAALEMLALASPARAQLTQYDFGLDPRFDPEYVFNAGETAGQAQGEFDLLWEAESYVPPFYQGRALPSAGTNISLQAIPRFKRADGSLVPTSELTFIWRRNGYVVGSASGLGKSRALLEAPALFGSDTVSVDARTADGLSESSVSMRIAPVEPRIVLYENHPLFGIMYHQALPPRSAHPDIEMSFSAIPYFADAAEPDDSRLLFEWRVNGNRIENSASTPSTITINAEGSSGLAEIELAVTHATNFFMESAASWEIALMADGASASPFAAPSQ